MLQPISLFTLAATLTIASALSMSTIADRTSGYILLQVEENGEAWYVYPDDGKRYYMADGSAAYSIMRELGLGITDADLSLIPSVSTTDEMQSQPSICQTNSTAARVAGRILLQVEQLGEAWYVSPDSCRRIYMADGDDAYTIMRYLGLGITNNDLEQIPVGSLSGSTSDAPSSSDASDKTSLFATMVAFNPNGGFINSIQDDLGDGWSAFIAQDGALDEYLGSTQAQFAKYIDWADSTGFAMERALPGSFVWHMQEPTEGAEYDWSVPDLILQAAGEANMDIVAVIHPFAAWDQPEVTDCSAIDFGYYDYKSGTPTDGEAYEAWIRAMVDRYDGDGVNDMPGLTNKVAGWEVGNEHDGGCQGNLDDPETYVDLLSLTYYLIKNEDPDAIVVNGGALSLTSTNPEAADYWEDFFILGGGGYTDAFNWHYNRERNGMSQPEIYIDHLNYSNELMDEYLGYRLPMWITEFGTFSGDAEVGGKGTVSQSEDEQAAWYFRYAITGFEAGVETIFVDLYGGDNSSIGGSALYSDQRGEARLFFKTLTTISDLLDGFDAADKLDEGQYVFDVDGQDIYALWADDLPDNITGTVTVIDYAGEESEMDADDIEYDEEAPVFILP